MQSILSWYVLVTFGMLARFSLYITQFAELKRVERDHAKEKQKLMKDKDAGPLN